jgi:hypothetical protein
MLRVIIDHVFFIMQSPYLENFVLQKSKEWQENHITMQLVLNDNYVNCL